MKNNNSFFWFYHTGALVRMHILEHSSLVFKLYFRCAHLCTHTPADILHQTQMNSFVWDALAHAHILKHIYYVMWDSDALLCLDILEHCNNYIFPPLNELLHSDPNAVPQLLHGSSNLWEHYDDCINLFNSAKQPPLQLVKIWLCRLVNTSRRLFCMWG
jgi:hypothetical protein